MPLPYRSPSGLLTRAAWEREVESRYERLPAWYSDAAVRNRRFLIWVAEEAGALAVRLADLNGAAEHPQIRAVTKALLSDADWARRQLAAPAE